MGGAVGGHHCPGAVGRSLPLDPDGAGGTLSLAAGHRPGLPGDGGCTPIRPRLWEPGRPGSALEPAGPRREGTRYAQVPYHPGGGWVGLRGDGHGYGTYPRDAQSGHRYGTSDPRAARTAAPVERAQAPPGRGSVPTIGSTSSWGRWINLMTNVKEEYVLV